MINLINSDLEHCAGRSILLEAGRTWLVKTVRGFW